MVINGDRELALYFFKKALFLFPKQKMSGVCVLLPHPNLDPEGENSLQVVGM